MNNRKNKNLSKVSVCALVLVLLMMSAAQGFIQVAHKGVQGDSPPTPPKPLDNPYITWEDNFTTEEYIEPNPSLSYNYELINGVIQMKNTYPIWTDPSWTRMKPINITNNAGQTLTNYAINITVENDSDMKPDYADIRFKHDSAPTIWLDYWIESEGTNSANVWVKIPSLPTGVSTLYLFYGNPNAENQSNFYGVFTDWQEKWANDEKISYHADTKEGAWDPDVAFGNGEFMVGWEQGQPYWPEHLCWGFKQSIYASVYDSNGNILVNQNLVFNDGTTYYRNENPSIDYGGGKFFIAWQHWQPVSGNPSDDTLDIKARTAVRSGGQLQLGSVIDVCSADNCQADANVQFDSVNNRFCVAWEDARAGYSDYDVWGRLYDTNGNPVGNQVDLTSNEANSQCEPWLAFDPIHQQYMLVYESGIAADTGPFSIEARIFDKDLNQIGDKIFIVNGSDSVDYNFPCVEFSQDTQRFLVTWNQDDISSGDWWGNVWGKILDTSGNVVVDTFEIKSGEFVRTDIVPYLSSSFFVSFNSKSPSNKYGKIWGKLISSDGDVLTDDIQLSASNSAEAEWNNLGVGNGKIFVAWEDIREVYPWPWNDMPDAFGNIWHLNIPSGSEVSYVTGTEKQIVLDAKVTSKPIQPDNLLEWYEFGVQYDGSITFNILDSSGNNILIPNANDGQDLSGINSTQYPAIRLQAVFTRTNPSYTPTLDSWSVTYIGIDNSPPETIIRSIEGDAGQNGWYVGNVAIYLNATDGGPYSSGVNHTYFKIDNGADQGYDDLLGIQLPLNATGDPNTLSGNWNVWYWSVDKAGNNETQKGPVNIKIDKAAPTPEIWDPPDRANVPKHGNFWVQATATDIGSGIDYVEFGVGPPYDNLYKVYEDNPAGSGNYKWLCNYSVDKSEWRHIIAVAHDYAGNQKEANIYVNFPRSRDVPGSNLLLKLLDILHNLKLKFLSSIENLRIVLLLEQILKNLQQNK